MPAGRPTESIPQDKAAALIEWIESGKPLREWCRLKGNPSYGTVYNWEKKDSSFAERIACARLIGEEVIAQECLAIADTPQVGEIVTQKPDGSSETRTEDMLGHRKLQIETRLKLLAKWNPRKWGDKIQQEVTGDGGGPVKAEITVQFVKTGS